MSDPRKKSCFVIGPFGEPDSAEREHADMLLDEVIEPTIGGRYKVDRADRIRSAGMITDEMIAAFYNSDLAIGDLTFHNPNAHYEIALRHASGKPIIHFRRPEWRIPFNLGDYRAISANISTARGLKQARQELAEYVADIEKPTYKVTNPVTRALGVDKLRTSVDDKDSLLASIQAELEDTRVKVAGLVELVAANVVGQRPVAILGRASVPNSDWSSLGLSSRPLTLEANPKADDVLKHGDEYNYTELKRRLSKLTEHMNQLTDEQRATLGKHTRKSSRET